MTDRSINIAIPSGLVVGHVGVLNTGSLAPGLAGDMTPGAQEPGQEREKERNKPSWQLNRNNKVGDHPSGLKAHHQRHQIHNQPQHARKM